MSRLASRVGRLEHQLGRCPSCASRRALIEIVTPNTRTIPGTDTDTGPCPACGEPRHVISCVFTFDLHDDDEENEQSSRPPGPGNEQPRKR